MPGQDGAPGTGRLRGLRPCSEKRIPERHRDPPGTGSGIPLYPLGAPAGPPFAYPIEYLLLGQHYLGNGMDVPYCGVPTSRPEDLLAYCAQTREALETGRFLYFAHPDLLPFTGDPALYEREMTKLCLFCRERNIPLEINLLGLREGRNYPGERFWKIAARAGNTVIYGSDAHAPSHVYSERLVQKADRFLERCGIPRDRLRSVLDF